MTAPKPAPLTAEEEQKWRQRSSRLYEWGRLWATVDAERAKCADLLAALRPLALYAHGRVGELIKSGGFKQDIRALNDWAIEADAAIARAKEKP